MSRISPSISVVPVSVFNNFRFYSQKSTFIIWTMYYMTNWPRCQVQWSFQCAHHILLCISLNPVPPWSLLHNLFWWLWWLIFKWWSGPGLRAFVMQTPARGVCVLWMRWTNSHGLQKSCGERGTARPLSERERASTLAWAGFYCFPVALHQRRFSLIILRFTFSDYKEKKVIDKIYKLLQRKRL